MNGCRGIIYAAAFMLIIYFIVLVIAISANPPLI